MECARLLLVQACRLESANAADFHDCNSTAYFVEAQNLTSHYRVGPLSVSFYAR
jgi:hypothetical protein